ncbi:MAG TPA: 2-oxoacid:ferredoxin oxidoreductase subunit gamma [Eggerthellaceae bacterium]|nr:2-oxoacid:ferredoxin oxidoreductase subunit gamma [Eggerthellaceae bacterium]
MQEMRIVLAGFGGQGLLFAGKVIAYAGLLEGRELSWLPSYGPEMRGGTANCSVTLSDDPIGSPLVLDPNVLIAMNQPSLLKFEDTVTPDGIMLVDTSLVTRLPERSDVRVCALEATNMAEEAGLKGLANIVLVGKLLSERPFCSEQTIEAAIRKSVPPRKAALIDKNLQALKLGMQA